MLRCIMHDEAHEGAVDHVEEKQDVDGDIRPKHKGRKHCALRLLEASIFDDGGEAPRIEAGAADQRAVDVGLGEEFLRVLGFDAAAVLDADAFGRRGG